MSMTLVQSAKVAGLVIVLAMLVFLSMKTSAFIGKYRAARGWEQRYRVMTTAGLRYGAWVLLYLAIAWPSWLASLPWMALISST